jgi:hypothetical protein
MKRINLSKLKSSNLFLILIFLFTFFVYFLSNPHPLDWYKHYVYLADAFLHQRLDIQNYPEFYVDVIKFQGKSYIPFPIAPTLFLIPFVAIFGTATKQPYIAMLIASLNSVLVYLLFKKQKPWQRLILVTFYSFGTVVWYAAVIGTTWFYALLCANFFLLLSLIFFLNKKNFFLSGLFLGAAALSRHPALLAGIFFLPLFFKTKKNDFLKFLSGLFFLLSFQLLYNYLRFGNPLEEGYITLYQSYSHSPYPYHLFKSWFPGWQYFGYLDPRNIPAHLVTLFLLLPEKINNFPFFKPSPYGMSVLLTSPLFLYLLKANFRKPLIFRSLIAALFIFIPIFFHYTQGWVQFGYRFLIDPLPFLMIILADGLPKKINRWVILFLTFSLVSNYFGVYWGKKLGW